MIERIKQLSSDTAVYGISTILGRFLTFILVPFYTNVLLPGDYGIVSYLYALIAFISVVYSYGMESAYFRFSSSLEHGTAKENFSTPFLSLVVSSLVFSVALFVLRDSISSMIGLPAQFQMVIPCTAGMLAFDAIAIIPFAALRMEREAAHFALIKILNIAMNVGLNIYFLTSLSMGVEGVFLSGVISSGLTILLLLPTIGKRFVLSLNNRLEWSLLKFALPIVPAALAGMVMQVLDRPILRALTDDATVGIYQANYRLGIFMMLVVSMYDYAWRPFYFAVAKDPDAKEIFSRVLTYLVLVMASLFLLLTLFIENIVKFELFGWHLIHPDYWGGLGIVPVVLLGYLFLGISTNLSAGLYITKKTHLVPVSTFVGAGINILANYLLIPRVGMLGAAWATLLAYVGMTVTVFVIVQRKYPIRYEAARLLKIGIAVVVILLLYWYVPLNGGSLALLFKVGLLWLFAMLMYQMKFFSAGEVALLRKKFGGKISGWMADSNDIPAGK